MNLQNIILPLPGIFIGLTIHEYCHALAASKLGDQTAKEMGRLTFNIFKHVDPIGFFFLIFAGFGWARPVKFNPENLSHPRRDKAIIAAAGPLSNLVLAFIFIALIKAWQAIPDPANSAQAALFSFFYSGAFFIFIKIIYFAAVVNLGLFIFNLIPVPPLDGSRIVFSGLNLSSDTEAKIMKIGAPLLLILFIIQTRLDINIFPIGKLITAIMNLFML